MSYSDDELDAKIMSIIRSSCKRDMTLWEIERELEKCTGGRIDTFRVRDSIWRMIHKGIADWSPLRHIFLLPNKKADRREAEINQGSGI